MNELSGKVAFITGGASGIGLGMAQTFAKNGMKVVLADIEEPALEKAVQALREDGAEASGVACDVSSAASVVAAADHAEEAFGKIHVLCNNAGVSPTGSLDECSEADWEWALGVNLMGVVHGIRTIVPRIKEHGEGGHVVNTSSIAGMVALPTLGIYTATKYAVVGISETLAGELAPFGIGVSVVCPAFVKTRLAEGGRNRPAALGEAGEMPEFVTQMIEGGMDPPEVGERVMRAIQENQLYVFTHADSKAGVELRMQTILDAFPTE
jgi:NAD(P)-dependent dehydrogenase (short-subunit alcohol dehydrogenase family)